MKEISVYDITENLVQLIAKDWMLVSSGNETKLNTMTASWGNIGYIWKRPVVNTVIRPQRYTYEFMEREDYFTLCFFDEEYRSALNLCGKESGRDVDKVKETGLTPCFDEEAPYFKEAKLVLICKKIAVYDLDPSQFIDPSIDLNYPQSDYHRNYTGEIIKVYIKG